MLSNFFTNAVKRYALKNWRLYSFKEEWLTIILLVLLTKIATSVVSVFSGYCYLDNIFYGLFMSENLSKIVTVFALVVIECLNALFLAKFFKFLLRFDNLKWIFPLLLSVGLFALSFIISTNGIAIYTAGKVDLSKNIDSKYITEIEFVNSEFADQKNTILAHIDDIKANPTEWKDGRRCVLSAAQLAEIRQCYDDITELTKNKDLKIKELNTAKLHELHDNKTNTENEANKYYVYVAAIMFVQLVASMALWFFWCKISGEEDPETNKVEAVERGLMQIESTVDNCINTRIDTKLDVLQTIYSKIAAENDKKLTATAEKTTGKQPQKTPKIIGFDSVKNSVTDTEKNADTLGVSDVKLTPVTASVNASTVCVECGKTLTQSQIVRRARFCCASCRVKNYNRTHSDKPIIINDNNLKH